MNGLLVVIADATSSTKNTLKTMMNDALSAEAKTLRYVLEGLNQKRRQIDSEARRIESRLLAIKWAQHPIGSMVQDDRGDMYQVGGYQSWNLLGYKIKKDGTLWSRMVPVVLKKDKI
jgi:hypothetical protein